MVATETSLTSSAAGGGGRRAVTAFFDERATAEVAVDDLVAAGVARERITLLEGGAAPVAEAAEPSRERSVWESVKHLFMADEDRHAYGEGLRRGGFLLSVETGAGEHDRVVAILDRDGAVDMDAREADWALEGWDPVRAAAAVAPSAAVGPAFGAGETRAEAPPAAPPVLPVGDSGFAAAAPIAPAPDPSLLEPAGAVGPAFGAGERRVEAAPGVAAAADRRAVDPDLLAPSAAVGPAFGDGEARRPAAAVRESRIGPSRLRTYTGPSVAEDPKSPG